MNKSQNYDESKDTTIFDFENFLKLFCQSLKNVADEYYLVEVSFNPDGITRERVFCYELYHQFRDLSGDNYPYAFHGELDKRGHIAIDKHNQKVPDFLVHRPGSFDENEVVIEVKGTINSDDIISDLQKIYSFISEVNYRYGLFLLINHSFEELRKRISQESLREIKSDKDSEISIICTSPLARNFTCHNLSDLR